MSAELRHIEQQMLMARPWDAAVPWSIWEITGYYPTGGGFDECLAVALPEHVTGSSSQPLFKFIGPVPEEVDPAWITHARPLMLVHRDDPTVEYEL